MIDYIFSNMWQAWVTLAVVCLIIELTAGDFFILCFSIGAAIAAISAAIGLNGYVQLVVFAVFTLIGLFWVRPFAQRYLHRGETSRVSNADALMGRKGWVVETVFANGYGRVQIDGDIWKAVTNGTTDIPEGEYVTVVGRESIIITVEAVQRNK